MGRSKKTDKSQSSLDDTIIDLLAPIKGQIQKKFRVSCLKFDHLKSYLNKFDDYSEISETDINIRIGVLSKLQDDYDQLMEQIIDIENDTEFEEICSSIEDFNNDVIKVKAELTNCVIKSDNSINSKSEFPQTFRQSRPKLPNLPIPSFSGNPGEWVVFKNTFVALVHDDPNISGVVKFSYLLDRLNAETKSNLGTISLTDEGYDQAWRNLLECFDNKRKIVDHHIDNLLNLPTLTKDNHKDLRKLINECTSNIASLEICKQKMDGLSEQLLINIVVRKMSLSMRKDWESELDSNILPLWTQLLDFLKRQCRILESVESSKTSTNTNKPLPFNNSNNKSKQTGSTSRSQSFLNAEQQTSTSSSNPFKVNNFQNELCRFCKTGKHILPQCHLFLNLNSYERYNKAKEFSLCINCLKSSRHSVKECKSSHCRVCKKTHHTLLHHDVHSTKTTSNETTVDASQSNTAPTVRNPPPSQSFHVNNTDPPSQVLLPTAIVLIKDHRGKYHECRALLDSGSQSNFISSSLAEKLKISRSQPFSGLITGLDQNTTTVTDQINTTVKSKYSKFEFEEALSLLVVPTISKAVPQFKFDTTLWQIPKGVQLADPMFSVPRPIDILLGTDIFFRVIQPNRVSIGEHYPTFHETLLGWIATGIYDNQSLNFAIFNDSSISKDDLQESLKRFFELDPVSNKPILSREEELCEKHYSETTFRDHTGRYVVSLPLKDNLCHLGESKNQAVSRFLHLERKLDNDPEFKQQYAAVIDEYKILGHLDKIDDSKDSPSVKHFYLPHHAVVKPSSTTTKVRVVFDASAKSTSNVSLNETMMVGPNVQQSCLLITLRFRQHKYAYTSDISKMYRQIKIVDSQRPLQRILWRSNKSDPLETFELNTVTFGTASAPFLATRTVQQLALDEKDNFPKASASALRDFYVDDCLSGSDDFNDAIDKIHQLRKMFSQGGFELRKWCANNEDLLKDIPPNEREKVNFEDISPTECIKTLGIAWQPKTDTFRFVIPFIETGLSLTKRSILSEIAKLYDPLGLLTPAIISAKILIQRMWKTQTGWDERVPPDILQQWKDFESSIPNLDKVSIDRRILCDNPHLVEIHGFSDASESAYGACIYIRSIDTSNHVTVRLLCSKSKVAPIKTISLPRLELCGALLLSRLLNIVKSALDLDIHNTFLWTDSTITLAWIKTEPYKLKTFIANRVNEIQDLSNNCKWNHVKSEDNPADIISRGISPDHLATNDTWFHGPKFLYSLDDFKQTDYSDPTSNIDPKLFELKPNINLLLIPEQDTDNELIHRFSSYSSLLRKTALILRFIHNCKVSLANRKCISQHSDDNKCLERKAGWLTSEEINDAFLRIVSIVQRDSFSREISLLAKGQPLHRKSSILSLNPFLDSSGILRVGGRLGKSNLNYDVKHQILLPAKHHFTSIVFRYYHSKYLHSGPQLLVSLVKQRFWPISAKNSAKFCVRNCVTCFRNKPQVSEQLMGDLPTDRFIPCTPFYKTGIDYCGPFMIKVKGQRKAPLIKVYVAVFVCFVTKCLHLEIVPDLTSQAFIDCLKRFTSRRGIPKFLYSDNASTFIGAKRELQELFQFLQNPKTVSDIIQYCQLEDIVWKFIPPRSPNFGGLWENSVKAFKTHLKRATMNNNLSYDEFDTLIIQIEGILNSRPLTVLSTDPSDPQPLTPAHFLCGRAITALPEPSLLHLPSNRLTNWQKLTQIIQGFWKRFSLEYFHTLQQRQRWKTTSPNLKKDDIVLIYDEHLPPTKWLMGYITEVFAGRDNKVRVVNIKTTKGTFKRGISKICKLPFD